ncbi:sensor histidine kinase [Sphingomonas adhaesiva]|uniref:sensor histidine kinase n=1 Tax=Sphingomonas adhaesiva TaxID=28212 RepID=UPI002FF5EA64
MSADARFDWLRWAAVAWALVALVVLFAVAFGSSARRDAIEQARTQAVRRAALEAGALAAEVEKFRVLPFVLVELPDVAEALTAGGAGTQRLDRTLRALAQQTGATVFYAIARDGIARSASNAGDPDSFVGHDFRFRPYFVDSLRNGQSEYFAQGSVTGRPGLFLARRAGTAAAPAGVVVVKIEFDRIERLWRSATQSVLVVDRDGVIVVGSDRGRRFRTIMPLSPERRAAIARSRQFGDIMPGDAGLRVADGVARTADGRRFLLVEQPLPSLNWRLLHLEPLAPVLAAADDRTRVATLVIAVVLTAAAGLVYWGMTRRRRAHAAREFLESEVLRRTAELTDAYRDLQAEGEERALADSRYRAAREELAQANRLGSIGTITTSVAHELNQPLAAIRTAAENGQKLLARERIDETRENLSLIVALTQRIASITGELLSYARRGRSEPALVPLDEIVDGALLLVGDTFRRAGVALEIVRAPDLPRLRVARIRIEQVLVNLLTNALDAVAGVSGARVVLKVERRGDAVRLGVADNGGGVDPAMAEAIFQPFYTGKPAGTGLGLGISREIVQDHGGTLHVTRSEAGGALFVVDLPLEKERVP